MVCRRSSSARRRPVRSPTRAAPAQGPQPVGGFEEESETKEASVSLSLSLSLTTESCSRDTMGASCARFLGHGTGCARERERERDSATFSLSKGACVHAGTTAPRVNPSHSETTQKVRGQVDRKKARPKTLSSSSETRRAHGAQRRSVPRVLDAIARVRLRKERQKPALCVLRRVGRNTYHTFAKTHKSRKTVFVRTGPFVARGTRAFFSPKPPRHAHTLTHTQHTHTHTHTHTHESERLRWRKRQICVFKTRERERERGEEGRGGLRRDLPFLVRKLWGKARLEPSILFLRRAGASLERSARTTSRRSRKSQKRDSVTNSLWVCVGNTRPRERSLASPPESPHPSHTRWDSNVG